MGVDCWNACKNVKNEIQRKALASLRSREKEGNVIKMYYKVRKIRHGLYVDQPIIVVGKFVCIHSS